MTIKRWLLWVMCMCYQVTHVVYASHYHRSMPACGFGVKQSHQQWMSKRTECCSEHCPHSYSEIKYLPGMPFLVPSTLARIARASCCTKHYHKSKWYNPSHRCYGMLHKK